MQQTLEFRFLIDSSLRTVRRKLVTASIGAVAVLCYPIYGFAQAYGPAQARSASTVSSASSVSDTPPIPSWVQTGSNTDTTPAVSETQLRTAPVGGNSLGRSAVSLDEQKRTPPAASSSPLTPQIAVADVPNGFQRFVLETTGRRLPIFGQDLFSGTPAQGFAPAQSVPAPGDYVIGPGDEIQLQVWGGVEGDLHLTVDRNGQINIPKVGAVSVAGARASELNNLLKREIGRVFTRFEVSASLGKLRSISVYVVGQARRPGAYTVSSLSTLINALFASGGPGPNGSMRHIELRRGGALVGVVDLYGFITKGTGEGDLHLLPGDVIVIPPAGPRVALLGALDTPGVYELKNPQEPLGQVLSYAGGTTALTSNDKVTVERVDDPSLLSPSRSVQDKNLDAQGLASLVKDGDVITLQKINPGFTNAITLRGNVAAPLRYPYKNGMHLSDLLPEPAALLTADYFKRKNVLVELDQPQRRSDTSATSEANTVQSLIDEPNWNYAVIERLDRQTLTTKLIPFNLGAVVRHTDPSQNLPLQPGDIVTVFGNKDMRLPQSEHTRLVRVDGEVRAAGVYELQPGDTLQTILRRAGGVTPEAYLFGTEFTREQTRVQQQANLIEAINRAEQQSTAKLASLMANLTSAGSNDSLVNQLAKQQQTQIARLRSMKPNGRVSLELSTRAHMVGDLPDLPLENGDAVYVPPIPAFITVVGAVNNDNAIIWKQGRSVSDVLKVAGVERDIADVNATFILRADGSVFADDSTSWFRSFKSTKLMPGDTVVVPERVDPRSPTTKFLAGLKDWTQVFANFGLGAAAIKILK